VLASTIPSCRSYDPAFAYELAVIMQDGSRRMLEEHENVFYYVTVTNESYAMPAMPKGAEAGIVAGMYLLRESGKGEARVQLLGSGAILREVLAAAEMLEQEHGLGADVWSVTRFTELKRDGEHCERAARLQGGEHVSHVARCLKDRKGPVIAATDYVRTYAEQIRAYVRGRYTVLGTDGFGRSDTRPALRRHFEVDRQHIVVAALSTLAAEGSIQDSVVREAIARYGIDPKKPAPFGEGA
jgi:pyruvate dehydrogenase E1 component